MAEAHLQHLLSSVIPQVCTTAIKFRLFYLACLISSHLLIIVWCSEWNGLVNSKPDSKDSSIHYCAHWPSLAHEPTASEDDMVQFWSWRYQRYGPCSFCSTFSRHSSFQSSSVNDLEILSYWSPAETMVPVKTQTWAFPHPVVFYFPCRMEIPKRYWYRLATGDCLTLGLPHSTTTHRELICQEEAHPGKRWHLAEIWDWRWSKNRQTKKLWNYKRAGQIHLITAVRWTCLYENLNKTLRIWLA